MRDVSSWKGEDEELLRRELYAPTFELLGFKAKQNKAAGDDQTKPDYLLQDSGGNSISAAFTYVWDRWLDGPDHEKDSKTPDENPGACVVTALEEGIADWIIVTNGRVWRLYSKHAHSRATNYYEVDLPETLIASGDTDPNEAFRYWWLFFRAGSFQPDDGMPPKCLLDRIAEGSTEYAKELGERLKDRIFKTIFPHLARGFLQDRKQRLGLKRAPSDDDLRDVFQGTLTLLYRLLFLLYAESRDLLPVREAPYHAASLKKLKQEIADLAGVAESEVEARINDRLSAKETKLYDRLQQLFCVMDLGDAALNVPTYNGGLFITDSDRRAAADTTQDRELRIARFLCEHKVPDRQLGLAIDLLSRDEDPKTFSLVNIDYKSLSVRHLGSIYEGLLEFKLQIADEDLTTQSEKGKEKYIALGKAKKKRGRGPEVVVRKGEVYLSNDKSERKATVRTTPPIRSSSTSSSTPSAPSWRRSSMHCSSASASAARRSTTRSKRPRPTRCRVPRGATGSRASSRWRRSTPRTRTWWRNCSSSARSIRRWGAGISWSKRWTSSPTGCSRSSTGSR